MFYCGEARLEERKVWIGALGETGADGLVGTAFTTLGYASVLIGLEMNDVCGRGAGTPGLILCPRSVRLRLWGCRTGRLGVSQTAADSRSSSSPVG